MRTFRHASGVEWNVSVVRWISTSAVNFVFTVYYLHMGLSIRMLFLHMFAVVNEP